jgi:hypothetical protein
MRWGRPVAALVLGAWLTHAGSSQGQAQQSYDSLIQEALQEFGDANYVEARILFERADQIKPNARTLRALGFCDYELKHYVDTVKELQAALTDTRNPLTKEQRVEVNATLVKAQRFIGQLVLETQPPDAAVLIDGRAVHGRSWALDAGDHVIAASASGYRSSDVKLTVSAGLETHTQLLLSPIDIIPAHAALPAESDASDPSSAKGVASVPSHAAADAVRDTESGGVLTKWWFWTAVGVVLVGATVGTVVVVNRPEKTDAGTSGIILHAQ